MSLGGSLCLSALSSQFCAVPQDSASNTPDDLKRWKYGVCVPPQDSASDTPELIWNGGSMLPVFIKTVPQIHPN
ncbi:UNVERIFIED_CONTAM: hypothetical protein Sradi_2862400 [Sesamum radiatum]|uniref:Uncharacterized protein n=1 Tax=Sesamum radiatum TaxID=300843 RepID=A0AAW2RWJ8_SESRA